MQNLLVVYGVIFCLAWWFMYGQVVRSIFSLSELGKLEIKEPENWPGLNIVIAACNEAETIEAAVKSLLLQDYPGLKVILVNDRSTDNTGEIIERLATDKRVTALQVRELPENWLGKVHAQSVALAEVDAEWVLFTDADIHFKAGALKKAVACALEKKVDHLALMPDVVASSYWLDVIIRTFGLMFLYSTRVHDLDKTDTQAVIGVGAFNLVRKSMLDKSKGIKWLRMEVADDVGMGLLIKRAGGKSAFAMAQEYLSVAWYPSIAAMFAGLEKNLFGGGAHYQLSRLLLMLGLMWLFVFAPFVTLLSHPPAWLSVFAAVTLLWLPVMMVIGKRSSGAPLSSGLFIPVGQLVISLMFLRSGIMCILRGGIVWRGTLYSTAKLKKYQRIKF
jgi:glycosyltransferase involved in cell wall biosynthesis